MTVPASTVSDMALLAIENLRHALAELTDRHLSADPEEVGQLAAVAVTYNGWRNTHLENLHAGDHPAGGFPDADMMRFNVATTRLIASHMRADPTDWQALTAAVVDADRVLPGGITLGELAGDDYDELAHDIQTKLETFAVMEARQGRAHVHTAMAMLAAQLCREWFGTPWWPDVVDIFIERLNDPEGDAWRYEDRGAPEPASVAHRDGLRSGLADQPESLDDGGIYWCLNHGLSEAANAGLKRWRQRRHRPA